MRDAWRTSAVFDFGPTMMPGNRTGRAAECRRHRKVHESRGFVGARTIDGAGEVRGIVAMTPIGGLRRE
jgi:hypothetical protein